MRNTHKFLINFDLSFHHYRVEIFVCLKIKVKLHFIFRRFSRKYVLCMLQIIIIQLQLKRILLIENYLIEI